MVKETLFEALHTLLRNRALRQYDPVEERVKAAYAAGIVAGLIRLEGIDAAVTEAQKAIGLAPVTIEDFI